MVKELNSTPIKYPAGTRHSRLYVDAYLGKLILLDAKYAQFY